MGIDINKDSKNVLKEEAAKVMQKYNKECFLKIEKSNLNKKKKAFALFFRLNVLLN